jgi:Thiamine pyrophosphate enzyme, C-terminal TPP binding domain/Malic enzyme, N-terminal domain
MNAPTKMTAKQLTGYDRLHNARFNKGTAFTEAERSAFGLEGLLPPSVLLLELQVARRHDEIVRLENDLLKYLVLSDLQARNETLYYAVLMSDPATYMPIVYTPTVGEACQKFGHIFRQPRGIYLPISARSRVPIIWTARYLKVNGRRRIIGSFNHGSMANAMLQAIGAQATYPDRQVISMSGDGGFSMMMGDFVTLTQMGLPVKVIVLNNGTLGFVEMEMKASGFLDAGCELKNPDFALMAQAMGVRGIRVEKPQELKSAIEAALAHKGPVLVDVVSARQELAMPPRTTLEQAYSFGIFMTKAVLDGRATQLIDLAKVNLFR